MHAGTSEKRAKHLIYASVCSSLCMVCASVCPGIVVSRLAQSQRKAVLQSEGSGWAVLWPGV